MTPPPWPPAPDWATQIEHKSGPVDYRKYSTDLYTSRGHHARIWEYHFRIEGRLVVRYGPEVEILDDLDAAAVPDLMETIATALLAA